MTITKEEAGVLSQILATHKYTFNDSCNKEGLFQALCNLEEKLDRLSKDKRRQSRSGRAYAYDFTDMLESFVRKSKQV